MFDLLFYLKELVCGLAIAFCVVTFCMSFQSDPTMREAAKEVWGSLSKWLIEYFDKKKEQKFFVHADEIADEIGKEVCGVVGDKRYENLRKLAQSAIRESLIFKYRRLGMSCIKVSVYYADDNEKQRLESLLTNVLVSYLSMCRCDTRVYTDWTMRNDLAMPVLRLHFAITKEQQKNLNKAFESRNKKIIAKNAPVVDDTEEIDLF